MATSPYLIREARRLKIGEYADPPKRDTSRHSARRQIRPRNRRTAMMAASAWMIFILCAFFATIRLV
jgi:hypothetical protein